MQGACTHPNVGTVAFYNGCNHYYYYYRPRARPAGQGQAYKALPTPEHRQKLPLDLRCTKCLVVSIHELAAGMEVGDQQHRLTLPRAAAV